MSAFISLYLFYNRIDEFTDFVPIFQQLMHREGELGSQKKDHIAGFYFIVNDIPEILIAASFAIKFSGKLRLLPSSDSIRKSVYISRIRQIWTSIITTR